MTKKEKVKVVVKAGKTLEACPKGMLRHDQGTPGPKCKD